MSTSLGVGEILDIGGSSLEQHLRSKLQDEFLLLDGRATRSLPTEVFYYGTGLQLWKQVCWLPDYHQTRDEISLLEQHGAAICREIPAGCTIVDMGSGEVQKAAQLLHHVEALNIPVFYFALDLCRASLEESMSSLAGQGYTYVQHFGLWGTFEDGHRWLQTIDSPKCVLSMGSMFGNDTFDLAVERMRPWREVLGSHDLMLLGMEARSGHEELTRMYHDDQGVWEMFIRNGLRESNYLLGGMWYRDQDWELGGLIGHDPPHHKFVLVATRNVDCPALVLHITKGEAIEFFESWKYGPEIMYQQFEMVGLQLRGCWASATGGFYQYLLSFA